MKETSGKWVDTLYMVRVKNHRKLIFLVLVVLGLGALFFIRDRMAEDRSNKYQSSIQDFYDPPKPLPSQIPGTLIRTEAMNIKVPGAGRAYRILYVSQLPDSKPAVSSGMIFVPETPAAASGRKIVAWSHGTLGFGDECTPSRSQKPLGDMNNWLGSMMQRGWVVVATDYVGLGTAGNPYYLIGESEAQDVLNSVRAARNFSKADAGNEFIAWGHSQGGHAALFTAVYAATYAPELKMVAVATAAPAAELNALFEEQYDTVVAWVIGPDAAVSWPMVYPYLPVRSILSKQGTNTYRKLAFGCVLKEKGELELREVFKEKFFDKDPMKNNAWSMAAREQTPPVGKISVPLYIAQGLNDTVVLPNTTALFVKKACLAKVSVNTDWLGDTNHLTVASVAGPSVTAWMQDRFDGVGETDSCSQPLPIRPAKAPRTPDK